MRRRAELRIWRPAMRLGAALALALSTSYAAGGCLDGSSRRPAGDRCGADRDCATGLVCAYGRCRPVCVLDRDCGPGRVCVTSADGEGTRVCTLPEEAACSADDRECPAPLVCGTDGLCHDPCSLCAPPRQCAEDVCYELPPPDADADADLDLDADASFDADGLGDGGVVDGGSGEPCRGVACPPGERCCLEEGETTPTCRTECSGLVLECTSGRDCPRVAPNCCLLAASLTCTATLCFSPVCTTDASCTEGGLCCEYPTAGSPIRVCRFDCP